MPTILMKTWRLLGPLGAALAVLGGTAVYAAAPPRVPWTILSSTTGDLPPPNGGTEQTTCVVADIDNDGDSDFFIADRSVSPSVILYRRQPDGWAKYVIDAFPLAIEAGGDVADIDGDGDLDLALGQDLSGGNAWWWENPFPALNPSTPWVRRLIKSGGGTQQHDQRFGDFDGDGRLEFATWVNRANVVEIYKIPPDPRTSPWNLVATIPLSGEGMDVVDVDLDGKLDILAGGQWIRHEEGNTYRAQVIDASYYSSRIKGGQFIPGGRPEVVMSSGDGDGPLNFYQYVGSVWQKSTIIPFVIHGHTLEAGDLDHDGHMDLFVAEMGNPGAGPNCKAWIAWGNGAGTFIVEELSTGRANHMSRLADLDGDSDLDIVMKPYRQGTPRVDVFLNNSPGPRLSLTNWVSHLVDSVLPAVAVFIEAADLDGDGDVDLAGGAWWWKNPGSLTGSWTRHAVGDRFNNLVTLHDFDGDGNVDMLGTEGLGEAPNHAFRWARNNGAGVFTIYTNIQTGGFGDFPQGRLVGVFQGDQTQVWLSWHNGGGGIHALTVPPDPANELWTFDTVTTTTEGEDLSAGDIDGDGDLDVLLGTQWLENTGAGWVAHTLGSLADLNGAEADRSDLADVDGDGDLDAVVALENSPQILWFENPRPSGASTLGWSRHVIGLAAGQGYSMDTRDMDGDGDPDVVLGEHQGTEVNRVIVFENNGQAEGWPFHVIDTRAADQADHHDGTQLVDLDGDGDLDLISIGWYYPKVWLFENTAPAPPTARVATPVFTPPGGTFNGNVQVKMSCATAGAEIRYTLDGTDPTSSSTLYPEPITLTAAATLRVRGFKTGRTSSTVGTADFLILPDTVPPVILAATAYGDPNLVVVEFSEPVDATTAQQVGNYSIDYGITIQSAALEANPAFVQLRVSPLSSRTPYTLTVRNIQDRSAPPNTVAPDHSAAFVYVDTPVSDDFSSGALNPAVWTFLDPLGDGHVSVSGLALRISVPAGTSHDIWTSGNRAPRVMQSVHDEDFELEVKFESRLDQTFQFQGLLVEENAAEFIRLDVYRSGADVWLFAANFAGGSPAMLINQPIPSAPVYWLRLKRQDHHWTYSYSTDGTTWTLGVTFTRVMAVQQVGIFAANAGTNPVFTAVVDYFFNTDSPIVPEDPTSPEIARHPTNLAVVEPNAAQFVVGAAGEEPLQYQWRRDGVDLTDATNSHYTLNATSHATDDQARFDVVVSNTHGAVTSAVATLTVNALLPTAPQITVPPANATVVEPQAATFSVAAAGTLPLAYQWRRGGAAIPGATGSSYTLSPTSRMIDDGAQFSVVVSNALGSVTSSVTTLTVISAGAIPQSGLALWLRADAGTVRNGSAVTQWSDVSGNNRHAVQATAVNQPALVEEAVNGLPAVQFDGVDDFATFNLPVNGLGGLSLFLVAANTQSQTGGSGPQSAAVFWNETAIWGTVYLSPYQSSVNVRFGTIQSSNGIIYPRDSSVGNSFTVSTGIKNGTTDSLYVNGVLAVSEGGKLGTIAGCRDTGNLGRGYDDNTYYAGRIAEVLVYSRALTAEEQQAVEGYLGGKYGLAAPVPPQITVQPASASVVEPGAASFSVAASGTAPLSYQWRRGGANIAGATASTYTLNPTVRATDDGAQFDVVVSNTLGVVTSVVAVLTVGDADFRNGLILWLKADAGFERDGLSVAQWLDHSGDNHHATQEVVSSQPSLRSNALGGQPVIQFDGVNDFLTFTLPLNGLSGVSIFLVAANTERQQGGGTQAGNAALYWRETRFWGTTFLSPFQSQVNLGFGTTQPFNPLVFTRPASLGSRFTLTAAIKDGPTESLYVDGELVLSQEGKQFPLSGGGDTGCLGRGYNDDTFYAGDIAEVLVYSRALTDSQRQAMDRYFAVRYAFVTSRVPQIISQPTDATVDEPHDVTFSVKADGTPPLAYQWQRNRMPIPGANDPAYRLDQTSQAADNGASFAVIVSNSVGVVTSRVATLSVNLPLPHPPQIDLQPLDLTVIAPLAATFSVEVSGIPPFAYQWRREGTAIPAATNPIWRLETTSAVDDGAHFEVVVNNPHGAVTSTVARLIVRQDLPANGLRLWLPADTVPGSNGSAVIQWSDQSGNNCHALAAASDSQPVLVHDGVNGKPAICFDGLHDFLSFTLPINGWTGMSLFLVAANSQPQQGGSTQAERAALYWREAMSWGTVYLSPFQSSVNFGLGTTQPDNQSIYTRPVSAGSNVTLSAVIKDGTTDALFVNGELVLSASDKLPLLAGCGDTGTLGRGYNDNTFYAGGIAEVMIYDRAVTEAERRAIEQYLGGKYGLLPANVSLVLTPTSQGFLLRLTGTAGRTYDIQRTPDLQARDWGLLVRTNSPHGVVEFEDTAPLAPMGFYRAQSP